MEIAVREVFTLRQFLKMPEIKPALEFIRGRIEQKVSPNVHHSLIATQLALVINQFVRPLRLGRALIELRCSFGDESYVPDISFISRARIPRDEKGRLVEQFLFAPDLSVEVLSPGQTIKRVSARLERCVQKGVRLGWLIQPRRERVLIFRADREPLTLGRGDVLTGEDVIPGFELPIDELFDWLTDDD